ncbi:MAG: hypothetical protein LBT11_00740 [Treponema sp.]|jgi:hypothetical protein|nr:hypothetical protein [Treponema sp.]
MYKSIAGFLVVAALFLSCESSPGEIAVADRDAISLGSVDIGFSGIFSSALSPVSVAVSWDPRTDQVYLEYQYQMMNFRQYWDASARAAFISALRRYEADYGPGLQDNSRTRQAYGKTTALIRWGIVKSMTGHYGDATLELGYTFNNGNPYFIVTQLEAKDKSAAAQDLQSIRVAFYFTRAMAASLAALFDDALLWSLLGDVPADSPSSMMDEPITEP